jgi:hypothetical protein
MSTPEMDSGNFEDVARRDLLDDDEREPQAIERDIDATRADMRATLEALERRFSLERLVDMTVGRIRERGGEFAGNLTDAATQNPMPLLLISIGLGWMMLSSRRGPRANSASYSGSGDYDYNDDTGTLGARAGNLRDRAGKIRDRASEAADRVHGAMSSTRETVQGAMDSMHSAMDSTRETVHSAIDSTRETWKHAAESSRHTLEQVRSGASRAAELTREQGDRMNRLLHEQPLMLGALGLAAGAIVGALLPTTEHENRMLGDMRNKAVKEVAAKSRAKLETAREQVAAALRPESSSDDGGSSGRQSASRPH